MNGKEGGWEMGKRAEVRVKKTSVRRGKSDEDGRSERFLTRKTGRERETEKEGAMLLERASGIIVARGNAVEPVVFLRADREGDIDRPCAG